MHTANPGTETSRAVRNRLARETSPYLLQHASNPVDWYPWGDEAIEKARREDKPIFLSVGYSACHWCHVMERESFENPAIAEILNRSFISIKVDREERPDIDRIYMKAVQMMTGRGGWPMSVFLTPELKPFYGGTYFPPEDRYGIPGFGRLLGELARVWKEDRDKIEESAGRMGRMLTAEDAGAKPEDGADLNRALLRQAVNRLRETFDDRFGGFGPAPKFPPAGSLELLFRTYAAEGRQDARDMAVTTLKHMARGGMYDQVGGGFHRYSTDARWLVPHFEKMLYDNALLATLYLDAYRLTGQSEFLRVAEETIGFVLRDMRDAEGGFHAALDADSEGEEGRYYVWSEPELRRILGEHAPEFIAAYGVTKGGNFEGRNILHLKGPETGDGAADPGAAPSLAESRRKLLAERAGRVAPAKDDKVLTNWNALMISALAKAYAVTGEERYLKAAREAADFLAGTQLTAAGLRHSRRQGKSSGAGFLDDYAYTVNAFVDLYEAAGDPADVLTATELAGQMLTRFRDPAGGSLFFAPAGTPHLLSREKHVTDEAIPSGNSMAARGLIRLARLTDRPEWEDAAGDILRDPLREAVRYPEAFMSAWNTVDLAITSPLEITFAGTGDDPRAGELAAVLARRYLPNATLTWYVDSHENAAAAKAVPLAAGRTPVAGRPAAYLCRERRCLPPVTEPEDFAGLLDDAGTVPVENSGK